MCTPATHTLKSDGTCGKCVFFFLFCPSLFIYFISHFLFQGWWLGLIGGGGGGIELEGGNLLLFLNLLLGMFPCVRCFSYFSGLVLLVFFAQCFIQFYNVVESLIHNHDDNMRRKKTKMCGR